MSPGMWEAEAEAAVHGMMMIWQRAEVEKLLDALRKSEDQIEALNRDMDGVGRSERERADAVKARADDERRYEENNIRRKSPFNLPSTTPPPKASPSSISAPAYLTYLWLNLQGQGGAAGGAGRGASPAPRAAAGGVEHAAQLQRRARLLPRRPARLCRR